MSWDVMKKSKEEGGSIFVKIKDGESIEGIFRGEPYCFYSKFKDPNEYQTWQEGLSFRFKINFVTRDDAGNLTAKIFQGGARLRDQLLDAKEEYGLDSAFKIKRTGSSKDDTRYSILFKQPLSPEALQKVNAIELHELKRTTDSYSDAVDTFFDGEHD